jgi:hypothetical protein
VQLMCGVHTPSQVLTVASEAAAVATSTTLVQSPPALPSTSVHADAALRLELARLAREAMDAREDLQRDEGTGRRTVPMESPPPPTSVCRAACVLPCPICGMTRSRPNSLRHCCVSCRQSDSSHTHIHTL